MAGSPDLILQSATEQLRRHAPFDAMSSGDMAFLVAGLRLAYFARGRVIASSRPGVAATLYIVQSRHVRGELEGGVIGQDRVEYGTGESFPLAAVMGEHPMVHEYRALTDTFCFEAGASAVRELAHRSPALLDLCSSRAGALLRQSYASLQAQYARQSTSELSVSTHLRDLLRRAPKNLDDWTAAFGIDNFSRHNALADALASAQLHLVLCAQASQRKLRSPRDLLEAARSHS